jgi:hypothetical protein
MTEDKAAERADQMYRAHAYNKPTNTVEARSRFGAMLESLMTRHNAPMPETLGDLQQGGGFVRACTRDALKAGVPEQEIRTLYAFCFT